MEFDELEEKSPIKRLGSSRKIFAFNHIRLQLNEQLKQLDSRVEAQSALAVELQELFKKRAEVEQEYSKGLDKLAKTFILRHREQKNKREQWPQFTSFSCWQQLVADTRSLARDHATLAELYSGPLAARLASAAEDTHTIYKACREICYESHDELVRALCDVQSASKLQHARSQEWRTSACKLRALYEQKSTMKMSTKKIRAIDKEIDKRRVKHADIKLKALKSRTDYLLSLEAANAAIHKYFVDDLSDIIDCMDIGFNNCISRALKIESTANEGRAQSLQKNAQTLHACVEAMDSRVDKQKFLEAHHQTFQLPKKITYQGQSPEEEDLENAVSMDSKMEDDIALAIKMQMEQKLEQLEKKIQTLRAETEEIAKTLEEAELSLKRLQDDTDARELFGTIADDNVSDSSSVTVTSQTAKLIDTTRSKRIETEDFYINKFREYLLTGGRAVRLEAKASHMSNKIGRSMDNPRTTLRRVGMRNSSNCNGLWSTLHGAEGPDSLPAPLVSASKVVARYGIKYPGLFRVSGSQAEISALKSKYERGRDPLASRRDASDIHSVAGLLKLYLRSLKPPLIPTVCLRHLLLLAQIDDDASFIEGAREFVFGLPKSNMAVLRYLFGFLSHVSEHSEENMMDAWNLAICFGPTLLRVPDAREPVHAQHLLNVLVRKFILLHKEIFPPPHYQASEVESDAEQEDSLDGDSEQSICDENEQDTLGEIADVEPQENNEEEALQLEVPQFQETDDDVINDDLRGHLEILEISNDDNCSPVEVSGSPVWKKKCQDLKPDLVVDLPAKTEHGENCKENINVDMSQVEDPTTLDHFLTNQNNTLKKRPNNQQSAEESSTNEDSPSAKTTAAKFADLTLTGGSGGSSFKPSIAIKPQIVHKN